MAGNSLGGFTALAAAAHAPDAIKVSHYPTKEPTNLHDAERS